ncbi:MAG: hypothetical protein PHV34_05835 [Verrucomicrobiae bacterium]|nr:hypothetical protein [Verrucomicrobiae bacterium]
MSKDSPTIEDDFARALDKADIRALLLGGVAVTSYGYPRLTEDTDWWIDPKGGVLEWAKRVLELFDSMHGEFNVVDLGRRINVGRYPKNRGNPEFNMRLFTMAENNGVIRIQNRTGTIDLFFLANNLRDFEKSWQRSEPIGKLRKLAIEDLIASKRGTGRTKDALDIQFLKTLSPGSS